MWSWSACGNRWRISRYLYHLELGHGSQNLDHAISGLVQPIQAAFSLGKQTPDEAYAVMLPTGKLAA